MPKRKPPRAPNAARGPIRLVAHAPIELVPAAVEAAEGQPALPGFKGIAYTGVAMRLRGFDQPVVVDLAGMRVPSESRPALRDHYSWDIVGHTESIENTGKKVVIAGVISGISDSAQEVAATGKHGFPWQLSLGASIEQLVFVAAGAQVAANGRTFTGPLYLAKKTTLKEISFVAMGADADTAARVHAAQRLETDMDFDAWLAARGFDRETLSEQQLTSLEAIYEREQTPAPAAANASGAAGGTPAAAQPSTVQASGAAAPAAGPQEDAELVSRRQRLAAEHERVAAIEAAATGHPAITAQAIRDGWSVERAQLEVLRAERARAPAAHTGGRELNAAALEASLLLASGVPEDRVTRWYQPAVLEAARHRDTRGMGLAALFHTVIQAAGMHARPGRLTGDAIRTAFEADRALRASGGFSTVSLSGILGNVANKALLAAYEAVPATSHLFCGRAQHSDFKTHTKYRLTNSGKFEKVGPSGELKHADLGEDSYTNKLETFGQVITLTRQMMINDDLGAFLYVPRSQGRSSRLAVELAVFELLLSNPSSFFSSDNLNYFEGADTALQIASLTTAEQKFRDQKDRAGHPIVLAPAVLLVPTTLGVTAELLFKERTVNETTTANKPAIAANPHAGKFRPVATPYLNNASITGYSSTAWYLFADPADVPAIELAYLDGREQPTLEFSEADFDTLGMKWRGFFDFGVAMQDHRAAVKSKGAA